jgi:predicted HicB family RNase H-like nuclease
MEQETRITLRLPAALHEQLKEAIKTSRRSLNSEILVQIERGLASKKEAGE